MIRGCLVLLLSGSANGCFGIGGGARSAKPPAPADYVARGLPPPPADLEAELERFANAIEGDAAMKASGVPESRERADALLQNLAAQSQSRLERPLPLDTVVAYFRAAADSMGQRHEVQELGGEHAMGRQNIQRSRPVQQMLFQAFYTALLGGSDRADALRHASYEVRQRHPDPHLWAPFVLIGQRAALSLEGQSPSVAGEDAESRFRRAIQHRRLKHSQTPMGRASWSVGDRASEGIDAYVAREVTTPTVLHINLLGRTSTLSVSAREYTGPGKYTASAVLTQSAVDPLAVDLARLHHAGSVLDVGPSEVVITQDDAIGFAGHFVIQVEGGQAIRGQFQLASAQPAVPELARSAGVSPREPPGR